MRNAQKYVSGSGGGGEDKVVDEGEECWLFATIIMKA